MTYLVMNIPGERPQIQSYHSQFIDEARVKNIRIAFCAKRKRKENNIEKCKLMRKMKK